MTSLDVICGLGPPIKNPGYAYGLYPGHLPSFGAQASLGGRARLLPGGARRNLMVRISLLARKFRGEEKKKGLQREILGSVLAFAPVFRPGTYLYSLWGGGDTSSILGGSRPQNALQWYRACYFLSGHHPPLGAHFSLEGHKQ